MNPDIEILDVLWFTQMGQYNPLGIVTVKNNAGTIRIFIGTADGDSPKYDAHHIASTGAEIHPGMLKRLIERIKK